MPIQKVIDINREKIIEIINIALTKEAGTEIFIPASSKKEQNDTYTCVIRELKTLSQIDQDDASSLTVKTTFRDKRFWVVLIKIAPALSTIYIKSPKGELERRGI